MGLGTYDFALAIGGEAGQGIATPGDILARIIVRLGQQLSTDNAYRDNSQGNYLFDHLFEILDQIPRKGSRAEWRGIVDARPLVSTPIA